MEKNSRELSGVSSDFLDARWFDPIEVTIRDRVRGFIEELVEAELDDALWSVALSTSGRRTDDGRNSRLPARATETPVAGLVQRCRNSWRNRNPASPALTIPGAEANISIRSPIVSL